MFSPRLNTQFRVAYRRMIKELEYTFTQGELFEQFSLTFTSRVQ